jgi:hypothetical protein
MAEKWGITAEKPKKNKKTTKKVEVVVNNDQFEEELKETFLKPSNNSLEIDDLLEKANKAKLNQEILKAEQLEYKIEQEKLKLKKDSGELIEYAMADYLFTGFMEKTNFQILTLIKKIEPKIINLCQENEPHELLRLLNRELEAIIVDIKRQQKHDVKNWEKDI